MVANQAFDAAIAGIKPIADTVMGQLRNLRRVRDQAKRAIRSRARTRARNGKYAVERHPSRILKLTAAFTVPQVVVQ